MLFFFEKDNEEGRESKRGILALKYFRIWKGESAIGKLLDMKEQFEKEMVNICESEIQLAHESCSEAKHFIENL